MGTFGILCRQGFNAFVKSQEILMWSIHSQLDLIQVHFPDLDPAFQASLITGPVKENPSHGLGGRREKVTTAVPTLDVTTIDQANVGVMHEGRGL
jgi:hypothetical protein